MQDYLQRLNGAQQWAYTHLDSYARTLARIIGFPEDAARLSFARRELHWQTVDKATIAQQQATADFYQAHALLPRRLDVAPTFDHGFQVLPASRPATLAQQPAKL